MEISFLSVFFLLVVFQFKHFIADYILQNSYMLGKFKDRGWELPLLTHCLVHFAFTQAITAIYTGDWPLSIGLATADLVVHFLMDRTKASPRLMGRWKALSAAEYVEASKDVSLFSRGASEYEQRKYDDASKKLRGNKLFWWSLGFDQLVHHLTDLVIAAAAVAYRIGAIQ